MTSRRLRLHSEQYGATGNIGENFHRLLGAPSLDPLQTLLREAVQNIADASLPETGPEIQIRLRSLTDHQFRTLDSQILAELPSQSKSRDLLSATLQRRSLVVMEICDFGTVGLGGPTRADSIPVGEERTDFIDFLRNVGTARDTEQGGGTYGFGKVALYSASKCGTIVIDSLPESAGAGGRRLMGSHVGRSFEQIENGTRRRFTGRHWWGVANPTDGIVDPVMGHSAAELASLLGMPARDESRTGTSIMILDFDTNGETIRQVGGRVIEGLLWNFWPRMMRDAPTDKRFKCQVEIDGSPLPIPSPEDFPPLDLFAKAMQAIRRGVGNDVRRIPWGVQRKVLGTLAVERGLRTRRKLLVADNSLFPEAANHIALMRPVELVVKYLEGTPYPDKRLEWAGVFLVSGEDEVERAFADSEPPAHDDWIPHNFPPRSNAKSYVTVALRKLKAIAADSGLANPETSHPSDTGPPLARVAGLMGAVLARVGGGGGSGGSGGGGRSGKRVRVRRPLFECLEDSPEGAVAVFSTQVQQDSACSGSFLKARPMVVFDGAGAEHIGDDIQLPRVLSIQSTDGDLSANGDSLALHGQDGSFEIRILVPEECAVTVRADVVSSV